MNSWYQSRWHDKDDFEGVGVKVGQRFCGWVDPANLVKTFQKKDRNLEKDDNNERVKFTSFLWTKASSLEIEQKKI